MGKSPPTVLSKHRHRPLGRAKAMAMARPKNKSSTGKSDSEEKRLCGKLMQRACRGQVGARAEWLGHAIWSPFIDALSTLDEATCSSWPAGENIPTPAQLKPTSFGAFEGPEHGDPSAGKTCLCLPLLILISSPAIRMPREEDSQNEIPLPSCICTLLSTLPPQLLNGRCPLSFLRETNLHTSRLKSPPCPLLSLRD